MSFQQDRNLLTTTTAASPSPRRTVRQVRGGAVTPAHVYTRPVSAISIRWRGSWMYLNQYFQPPYSLDGRPDVRRAAVRVLMESLMGDTPERWAAAGR